MERKLTPAINPVRKAYAAVNVRFSGSEWQLMGIGDVSEG